MRLIDADKLKRKAQKLSTEEWKTNRVARVTKILNQFIDWIEGMPTINAVEIVRCKDCIHWTEEKDEEDDILYGWCRAPFENDNLLVYGDDATRIFTVYDFFCKSGERG